MNFYDYNTKKQKTKRLEIEEGFFIFKIDIIKERNKMYRKCNE